MIFGYENSSNKDFLVYIDILEKDNCFLYGIFNFIFQEKIYPAFGTGWTINHIVEYMTGLLQATEDDFYYKNSDTLDGASLFKEAVISRLGYFYDNPDKVIPENELKKKHPKKIGVELEISELGDSGLEIYIFKGDLGEYMVFCYDNEVTKFSIEIDNIKMIISHMSKFVSEFRCPNNTDNTAW